jgi:hypothetical protein
MFHPDRLGLCELYWFYYYVIHGRRHHCIVTPRQDYCDSEPSNAVTATSPARMRITGIMAIGGLLVVELS